MKRVYFNILAFISLNVIILACNTPIDFDKTLFYCQTNDDCIPGYFCDKEEHFCRKGLPVFDLFEKKDEGKDTYILDVVLPDSFDEKFGQNNAKETETEDTISPCNPADCDDNNPCTDDFCDENGKCAHSFNDKECNDNDPCTVNDHCTNGVCKGVLPKEICGNGIDENCDGVDDYCVPPQGMVYVDGYYIDKYEASHCDDDESRACSVPYRLPWTDLTFNEAQIACMKSGKRLCTKEEWFNACSGDKNFSYPYGNEYKEGYCNDSSGILKNTGSFKKCFSQDFIYDLSGNAYEWVGTTQESPYTAGGNTTTGALSKCNLLKQTSPVKKSKTLGFRCCIRWDDDLDSDGYLNSEDCDDTDSNIHPEAEELCNGIDDNCNGETDEGYNVGKPCYKGTGYCKVKGKFICSEDGKNTVCYAIKKEPLPYELCGNKIDDDCDGETDEGFEDVGKECVKGVGACAREGKIVCSEDRLSTFCDASPLPPKKEICGNDIDDDCDGETDEGFNVGKECSKGIGECRKTGILVCSNDGLSVVCNAEPGKPEVEVCDGKDNDCDGLTDENFKIGAPCSVGVGACEANGETVCSPDGKGVICNATPLSPKKEICGNGIDDDCDGSLDNGFPVGEKCSVGVGACKSIGVYVCSEDGLSVVCNANPKPPQTELCGNLKDDDCDGETDEGFDVGAECYAGTGECKRKGKKVCSEDQTKTVCNAKPGEPQKEICDNGKDDDCDGKTDCDDIEDCHNFTLCTELDCSDNVDNDGDGKTDCADDDCDGKSCNDGKVCTQNDTCFDGKCEGEPGKCDDLDPCTNDWCIEPEGCVFKPKNCDDQNLCTIDSCDQSTGNCIHKEVTCNDNDPCTVDKCNPTSGCYFEQKNCDDGNACTNDHCDPETGSCIHETIDCDDNNKCTNDGCSKYEGCYHTPVICNDYDLCTIDTCDPEKGCVFTEKNCDDNNACTIDSCEEQTGQCLHIQNPCDDNNKCTDDDCNPQTGCIHTKHVCDDGDLCTVDGCDPISGCYFVKKNCPPGLECNPETGNCE